MLQQGESQQIRFESFIDLQVLPYLNDYQFRGVHIFPFAAFLEMSLAAAHELYGQGGYTLEEAVYHEALPLFTHGGRAVGMSLVPEGQRGHRFEIHGLLNPDGDGTKRDQLHVSGRISRIGAPSKLENVDLAMLRARCQEISPPQALYTHLDALGLHYGSGFQGLQQIWLGKGEALGHAVLPVSLQPETSLYQMHPALLDTCMQILQPLMPDQPDQTLYMPCEIAHLSVYARPGAELWSWVRLQLQDEETPEILQADITLLDGQGHLLAQMRNVCLRPVADLRQIVSENVLRKEQYITRELLSAELPDKRRSLLEIYLRRLVAQARGTSLAQITATHNLAELALGSIMVIELKQRIKTDLEIDLAITSFVQDISIAQLASRIAEQVTELHTSSQITLTPVPEERYQPFPLNDIQQAYWLGQDQAFELSGVASHIYAEYEGGELDIERLNRAWQRVVGRHDMLRAIVRSDGLQQILEQVPSYRIEIIDLREKSAIEIEMALAASRREMTEQVKPMHQWPLFQIRLHRLPREQMRLNIWLDLLISDAMSFRVIMSEWSYLYQRPTAALPQLEITFRDYVIGEQKLRRQEAAADAQDRAYWHNRLSTLPPSPALCFIQQPEAQNWPPFLHQVAELDAQTWLQLKARAARAGISPAMMLCSAFAEILTTWSSSSRFTLVLTRFNRLPLHERVKEIVGDFTSTTLLAVEDAGGTFEERARHLQHQLWQDLEHSQMSGVRVLRELARLQGNMAQARMPVVFTCILNSPDEDSAWLEEFGRLNYLHSRAPQIWLDNQIYERGGTLLITWEAMQNIFPSGLPQEMFAAYIRLLRHLADDEQRWQQYLIDLLPAEQLQLFTAVNETAAPVPAGLLHTPFLKQVSDHVEQLAVISSARTLTYLELDQLSYRVGQHLLRLGAKPNTLVGVVMEKGWEQVVAVLGILRSGAAYLPVDPHLPQERLWHLLARGEVQFALTQPWIDADLNWPAGIHRVTISGDCSLYTLAEDTTQAEPLVSADDLAYVIFTSGSTGQPKGVAIDHRGALNTIVDINQRFQVGAADRVLALSALNFDLSVYDIFGTLGVGGTIVVPDARLTNEPDHWAELVLRERVTIWNSVPALVDMFVEYVTNRAELLPTPLRLIMMSGDWIPVTLPDRIRALLRDCEIISMGGATEASIWSIIYPIHAVNPSWRSIPYGRPLLNQRFYVLNHVLEPCPVWIPGYLYIGGIGLAKGYWRDEEKTVASFITHPRTGERLYRTGDLGRRLPDGNIEFLGRDDFQVKVRGYRIELGEIEATLRQHPAVQEAIVIVREDEPNDQRLVAYVVQQPSSQDDNFNERDRQLQQAQLMQWKMVYDEIYERAFDTMEREAAFVFNGWTSAYTNQPMPREEMKEWVEQTISRVKTLRPSCVLEIGCGTGLLLLRLLPLCTRYCATDLSPVALRMVEHQLSYLNQDSSVLTLLCQQADDFGGIQSGTFDTIILNSVVQYFPDIHYLRRVIEGALKVVKPGGTIFIGDLRNCSLLKMYCTAVELHQAPDTLLRQQLSHRVQKRMGREEELLIDPAFFLALQQHLPDLAAVEILHKRGLAHNELTQFRYDVILRVGGKLPMAEVTWLDWHEEGLTLSTLRNTLLMSEPAHLGVTRVPNSRLALIAWALDWLNRSDGPETVGEFKTLASGDGIDPEDFWSIGLDLPYTVNVTWAGAAYADCYNVIFRHNRTMSGEQTSWTLPCPVEEAPPVSPWETYANAPLHNLSIRNLSSQLSEFLKQKLPDYMVPSAFVVLDSLPLTANGKINRQGLPAPEAQSAAAETMLSSSQTEVEKLLADIWTQVLGLKTVGIHEDFFTLGGHSLLAMQIVTQIRETFGIELKLQSLFNGPTIAALAEIVEDLLLKEIEELPEEEAERLVAIEAMTSARR